MGAIHQIIYQRNERGWKQFSVMEIKKLAHILVCNKILISVFQLPKEISELFTINLHSRKCSSRVVRRMKSILQRVISLRKVLHFKKFQRQLSLLFHINRNSL